ncbi:MAG: hypothetical protein ACYTGR_03785 [Planctomycetota bacterium]|jgi:hypothetical protein
MAGRGTVGAVAALLIAPAALACPDTNGDDAVDVQDLTAVILDWGSDGSGNNGDVNGDGLVDVTDLTEVILAWGPFECPSEGCEVLPGAPANDCCATATVLTGNPVSVPFDTTNANTDGPFDENENCSSAAIGLWKDVWFSYTPDQDGILTIGNCNEGTYDSKLFVYAVPDGGDPCDGDTLLANLAACNDDCPDDNGIFTSEVVFTATGGQEYLIRMGGYSPNGEAEAEFGTGTLTISNVTDNDVCELAQDVELDEVVNDTTCGANVDESNTICGGAAFDRPGRWYRVLGDGTTLTASLCNTDNGFTFDTRLAVYCDACTILECVGSQSVCNAIYESTEWCSVKGQSYLVYVAGDTTFAECGEYELVVTSNGSTCSDGFGCASAPANDDCADATELPSLGLYDFSSLYSTDDGPALPEACDEGFGLGFGSDIWYSYTPDQTGTLTLSTCNTDPAGDTNADYDTRTAAYTGGCGNLVLAACNDDGPDCGGFTSILDIPVDAGTPVLIRLGGFDGASGTGTFELSFTP